MSMRSEKRGKLFEKKMFRDNDRTLKNSVFIAISYTACV